MLSQRAFAGAADDEPDEQLFEIHALRDASPENPGSQVLGLTFAWALGRGAT